MGYAQNTIKFGGTAATAQFFNLGNDNTMPIGMILPIGDETSDNVFIQTLDASGRTVDNYSWVNWAGDNGDEEAWIDDNFDIVQGVSFAPGAGIWVQSNSSTDLSIQTAGSVGESDVTVALRFGGTLMGNPFPVALDIQDILPEGDETSDNVFIQTLDASGRTIANYSWVNWAGENGDKEAWIDDNFDIVQGVTFGGGVGIWVQTNATTEQYIRFPAPEL